MGGRVAVAAPNPAAAGAGARVAAEGGNAVDAALAALLVALVSEPGVASLGGGAFVTVLPPGGPGRTVDGSVAMPGRGLPRSAFGGGLLSARMDYGGGTTTEVGYGSVAVPGALAAAEHAQRRYGRLPWAEVVAPARELARDGFRLGRAAAAYLVAAAGPVFGHRPDVAAVLRRPDGSPVRAGDRITLPGLADFLALVAERGAAALSTGEVAAALVADMAAHGGLVTAADLARYEPVERPALAVTAAPWALWTNPPPAVGGPVLAAMLGLLADPGPAGVGLGRMVEVQRAVLGYRVSHLEAAVAVPGAAEKLLAAIAAAGPGWTRRSPSTVHVSAVDGDGTACAVTSSAGYGAGVAVPGTGVWLNNCLGEHELNRAGWDGRAPGERLVSNMAPTVGRRADGGVLAIGSPGADRIATAVLQVLVAMAAGADPQVAVDRPRLHVTCGDDGLPVRVEHETDLADRADLAGPDELAAVRDASGLPWREHPARAMFFGGVGLAIREAEGRLLAAADPRREGAVLVSA